MKKALASCGIFLLCSLMLSSFFIAFMTDGVPQVVLDARNSVVRIICYTTDNHVNGDMFIGSGFAIGKEAPVQFFVTNYHVVSHNEKGIYILRGKDSFVKANVVYKAEQSDLCILQVDVPLLDVPPVTIRDKEASVGAAVYALGFPGAADSLSDDFTGKPEDVTITNGIVSAEKSLTLKDGAPAVNMLQVNAAISPGNSGGPLVNELGYVVGIDTYAVVDSQNINGAISSTVLSGILKDQGYAYLSEQKNVWEKIGFPFTAPVLPIVASAVVLITGILIVLFFRKRAKRVSGASLDAYLQQWGGRVSLDMAVRILSPVFAELAHQHHSGVTLRSISPASIVVDRSNRAHLKPADKRAKGQYAAEGFSAPELYMTNGMIGPWTDIYAICAVLYYMITGIHPLSAIVRQGGQNDLPLTDFSVDEARSGLVLSGMSLNPAERPKDIETIVDGLGIDSHTDASLPQKIKPREKTGKKGSVGKKLILAVGGMAVVCAGVVAGAYVYFQSNYDRAMKFADEKSYSTASETLGNVPAWFRDAREYQLYCNGKDALQAYRLSDARFYFSTIQNYRDVKDQLREVVYQDAIAKLNNKNWAAAEKLLSSILDYKDASKLMDDAKYHESNEMQYRKAEDFLAKNDLLSAMKIYIELNDYKDSNEKIISCKERLYDKGVTNYRDGQYSTAKYIFEDLDGYSHSDYYTYLCDAHSARYYDNYSVLSDLYSKLRMVGAFEDAESLLDNDAFIFYRLNGKWSDSSGHYFSLMYVTSKEDWTSNSNIPCYDGEYYKIENMAYYVGDDSKGWEKAFGFILDSDNSMRLICYKNKTTYVLTK